jgi:hypothetical protein
VVKIVSLMYYERQIKDLKAEQQYIVNCRNTIIRNDMSIDPVRDEYRIKAKVLRKKVLEASVAAFNQNAMIISKIQNKNVDVTDLFRNKLELTKLEMKKNNVQNSFRDMRFAYYKKIAPVMKVKRHLNQDIKIHIGSILEKIKAI